MNKTHDTKDGLPALDALRIVVVEDTEDARLAMRFLLERKGHEVREAADGRAGLEAIESWRPDLAFVDLQLPLVDGLTLARSVRAQSGLANVSLVALSGFGAEEDQRQSREAGFQAHLVKPLRADDLDRVLADR